MKKWISLALVFALCLGLAACGKAKPMTTPEKEALSDTLLLADLLGEWDGDTYTNAPLGFGYTKPSGWQTKTPQELCELVGNSISDETWSDREALSEALAVDAGVSVFFTQHAESNVTVMATLTFLERALEGEIAGVTQGESGYEFDAAAYADGLAAMYAELSTDNYKMEVTPNGNAEIAGKQYASFVVTTTINKETLRRTQYVRQLGDYFLSLSVTQKSTDNTKPAIYLAPFFAA